MQPIAVQPYIKIERQVTSIHQVHHKDERKLYLYHDRVVTKHRVFPIQDVLDMSFHNLGKLESGILYLHTSKGVYSYQVTISPQPFIDAFKKHVKK